MIPLCAVPSCAPYAARSRPLLRLPRGLHLLSRDPEPTRYHLTDVGTNAVYITYMDFQRHTIATRMPDPTRATCPREIQVSPSTRLRCIIRVTLVFLRLLRRSGRFILSSRTSLPHPLTYLRSASRLSPGTGETLQASASPAVDQALGVLLSTRISTHSCRLSRGIVLVTRGCSPLASFSFSVTMTLVSAARCRTDP